MKKKKNVVGIKNKVYKYICPNSVTKDEEERSEHKKKKKCGS